MSAAKKSFPGIFVVIIISFAVYLTIVTGVILMHYSKRKGPGAPKDLKVSQIDIPDRSDLSDSVA